MLVRYGFSFKQSYQLDGADKWECSNKPLPPEPPEPKDGGGVQAATIAAVVGAGLLVNSTESKAFIGAGAAWASFDAMFAGLMASVKVLSGKIADAASDVAVDMYKDQKKALGEMFKITNAESNKLGTKERAAQIAIADDDLAFKRQNRNKKIIEGNQAPPSACLTESMALFFFNEYPKVKERKAKRIELNLNELVQGLASETITGVTGYEPVVAPGEVRKTLSVTGQQKMEKRNSALIFPMKGKLEGLQADKLDTVSKVKAETVRQSLLAAMTAVLAARQGVISNREGVDSKTFRDQINSLAGSDDSRDKLLSQGLKKVYDKHSVGDTLSSYGMLEMIVELGKTPEYSSYINKLGKESAPFLKEMIFRKEVNSDIDKLINEQQERILLLTSYINQLTLQKKLGI